MSSSNRAARGTSLIELLFASLILSVGLTAVLALLNQGVSVSSGGIRQYEASAYGVATLNQLAMRTPGTLPLGRYDAGAFITDAGQALYWSEARVESLAALAMSSDGGAGSSSGAAWPGNRITVTVTWREGLRVRTQTFTTLTTEAFDGG